VFEVDVGSTDKVGGAGGVSKFVAAVLKAANVDRAAAEVVVVVVVTVFCCCCCCCLFNRIDVVVVAAVFLGNVR
jgi:hypothetical protein